MKYTYVGELKVIQLNDGRIYKDCEQARQLASDLEWAKGVLTMPNTKWPNGRMSHEVATELGERAEDALLEYQLFTFG